MEETNVRYTLDTAGSAVTIRRTSTVSANDMNVSIVDNKIFITPKPQPQTGAAPAKYRLEPEGSFYRVYAVRDIGRLGVVKGARGGLVKHEDNLAQAGDCWIEERVTLLRGAKVYGDAYIYGNSVLDGPVTVSGNAYVSNCQFNADGAGIVVSDNANVSHCKVEGPARLVGYVHISNSTIAPAPAAQGASLGRETVSLHMGEYHLAHLTKFYEALSMQTRHGLLTVYRGSAGQLVGNVGCQQFDSREKLHEIANGFSATGQEKSMIDGFFAMVDAAQAHWTPFEEKEEVQS